MGELVVHEVLRDHPDHLATGVEGGDKPVCIAEWVGRTYGG
jgi:hypothetical protein